MRFFLGVAAQVYSTVIRLRNLLYSKRWLKTYRANAMVFSIGNITVGGTGKTPLVIWLCKYLQKKQINCAILTRGYKTNTKKRATSNEQQATKTNEPAILTESCPEAKVIVNPNRVAGATEAVNKFGATVLIMDDGFQHRRLARDLDIVTIDGTRPFGYGKVLPAGLLREPVAALKRTDAVVVTRCDQTAKAELTRLEDKLQRVNPNMIIARSIHTPICVKSIGHKEISLEEQKNKKIFAFCGIANPDAFLNTIENIEANLVGSKIYNDHYHYTDDCLADIYEQARHLKADLILTTQKDWFSSPLSAIRNTSNEQRAARYDIPFAYLAIELRFISGEDKITQLIEDALAGKIPKK
ncbi:MAG: tetraacyldisaccharide 4'-kinase [Planctomycetota bacterium]